MSSIREKIKQNSTKNTDLLEVLAATSSAPSELKDTVDTLEVLRQQFKQVSAECGRLGTKRLRQSKQLDKYRKSTTKRFAYRLRGKGDELAAVIEREERTYQEALTNETTAREEKDLMAKRIDELQNRKGQLRESESISKVLNPTVTKSPLEATCATNRDSQAQLDTLYDEIFSASTAEYPEDSTKQQTRTDTAAAYRKTRTLFDSEIEASQLLKEAAKELDLALRSMSSAHDLSRADMFGGGTLTSMAKRSDMDDARGHSDRAARAISQALERSDHVRTSKGVQIDKGHGVGDVLFDSIFSDIAVHEQITQGEAKLREALTNIEKECRNAEERAERLKPQVEEKKKVRLDAKQDLQRYREAIFEEIMAAETT